MKKIEIIFKHMLLRILLLLYGRHSVDDSIKLHDGSKILLIRLNRIGDALITTPLICEIKRQLNCSIHLLADKNNHFIFENNPTIDKTIIFRKGLKGFRELLHRIRTEDYDAIVDLHDDVSTTVTFILAMSGVKNIYGLSKGNDVVYSKTIPKPDARSIHVVDRIMEIGKLIGLAAPAENVRIKYAPKEESVKWAKELLHEYTKSPGFFAAVSISAGSTSRFWGVDKYKALLSLFQEHKVKLAVFCAPGDKALAEQICQGTDIQYFYSDSFDKFAAMISQLDFLFTPDTSTVHLAAAFNIPMFGIYVKYNTSDMIWSPYNSKFDCVITTEKDFSNLSFDIVKSKLNPFLEMCINEKRNTQV